MNLEALYEARHDAIKQDDWRAVDEIDAKILELRRADAGQIRRNLLVPAQRTRRAYTP